MGQVQDRGGRAACPGTWKGTIFLNTEREKGGKIQENFKISETTRQKGTLGPGLSLSREALPSQTSRGILQPRAEPQ